MQVNFKPFGAYQTNCYICDGLIIDPGVGATEWVLENVETPKAILLTHGHFDHMWSAKELKERLKIPIYIHKEDSFMLKEDIFGMNIPKTEADFLIDDDKTIYIDDVEVTFKHFPGHTPGSITIEIDDIMLSGDFVFQSGIGRIDFPYSDPIKMKQSLEKFLKLNYDKIVYPGHGNYSTIKKIQYQIANYWVDAI